MQKQQKCFVLTQDSPTEIQFANIEAIDSITTFLKTCLGPKSFQKMILTRVNTIELTNDGNSILRELDVSHPALKIVTELCRTQDELVGDGTTSVVILVGEFLKNIAPLMKEFHPVTINSILQKKCKQILTMIEKNSIVVNEAELSNIVESAIKTKLCNMINVPMAKYAMEAISILSNKRKDKNIIKTSNLRIEKVLGDIQQTRIIKGQILNKTIYHAQMRKKIENPRVILIQSSLEFKKAETQVMIDFNQEEDHSNTLKTEEDAIRYQVEEILKHKPDIVCCEKGISDFALGLFQSNNVTAMRRFKKTEMDRLSQATKAKVVNSADMLNEDCVGKNCSLFEYIKIHDEYYCLFDECKDTGVCALLLYGPSKTLTSELERNFWDAFKVAKCLVEDKRLVPGGGGIEYYLSQEIFNSQKDKLVLKKIDMFRKNFTDKNIEERIEIAISNALKSIPILLCSNTGGNSVESMVELDRMYKEYKEKKITGIFDYGVDGNTGNVTKIRDIIMEPIVVKTNAIKSAIDTVCLLLRVDGIVKSGQ